MNLTWLNAQYEPIEDTSIQGYSLGRWIEQRAEATKRRSGLGGELLIVFETPDKLVLWFKNEKGLHDSMPKFVMERTQFEVEEYGEAVTAKLETYFGTLEQM